MEPCELSVTSDHVARKVDLVAKKTLRFKICNFLSGRVMCSDFEISCRDLICSFLVYFLCRCVSCGVSETQTSDLLHLWSPAPEG